MTHTRGGKAARLRRQQAAADRAKSNEQYFERYVNLTPQERLIEAIFGVHDACMECGNSILRGTDCMSPHCKELRGESSMFYDGVTDDSITIKGATMQAGVDY